MPENTSGAGAVFRDSAIIITGATVLLFVWGYAFEAFRWTGASVPGLFQPEVAVQERVLVGGILALFVFIPISLLCWAFDILIRRRMSAWLARTWQRGYVHQAVVSVLLFAASVALVRPIGSIADRFGRRLRVESITLKSHTVSPVGRGMYCIGKRGATYVFVDGLSGPSRRILLITDDDISALVLTYSR